MQDNLRHPDGMAYMNASPFGQYGPRDVADIVAAYPLAWAWAQGGDPGAGVARPGTGEELGQQPATLPQAPTLLEPAPRPAHDPQAEVRQIVGDREVERRPQVAVFTVEPMHEDLPGRAEDRLAGGLGQGGDLGHERPLDHLPLPNLVQALLPVFPE